MVIAQRAVESNAFEKKRGTRQEDLRIAVGNKSRQGFLPSRKISWIGNFFGPIMPSAV